MDLYSKAFNMKRPAVYGVAVGIRSGVDICCPDSSENCGEGKKLDSVYSWRDCSCCWYVRGFFFLEMMDIYQ